MPEASPFWQNAFLGFLILLVAWSVWAGWRAGVVREALALGGMFAGGFAGLAAGGAVGPLLGKVFPVPGLVIGVVVGLVVGIGVYLGAWVLGAVLFKRTAQQPSFLLRMVFGGGGALVGLFVGVTLVWGALLFVRGLGGFYEGTLEPAAARSPHIPPAGATTKALVKLKRSIEAGSTGQQLVSMDVMPDEFYRIFDKLGQVAVRPDALRRLADYPPVVELLNDPRIVAIASDPETADAAREQGIAALMKNPHILQAANDPALIAKVQKLDIEKALDFALAAPAHPAKKSPVSP
ncbi:MAG TPA: CvpA family protein [Chthoniobacterales bacterium]